MLVWQLLFSNTHRQGVIKTQAVRSVALRHIRIEHPLLALLHHVQGKGTSGWHIVILQAPAGPLPDAAKLCGSSWQHRRAATVTLAG